MEKKTNKAKLEIFKFLIKSARIARLQPLIKLAEIVPSMEIQQIYTYQGIFACRINICHENSAKSYGFHENAKIIENHSFLLIV